MSKLDREQIGELLSAYLDGETGQRETQLVENLLREDESARQELQELRNTIDLVGDLPRHAAPPSIAEDLRDRMERRALLGSSETSPVVVGQGGAPRGAWVSIAAMIGLVAIVGVWFLRDRGTAGRHVDRLAQVDHAKRPDTFRDDLEVKASRRKLKKERSRVRTSPPLSRNAPAVALRKERTSTRRSKPVAPRSRLQDRAAVASAEEDAAPRPHQTVRPDAKRARAVNAATLRTQAFAHEPLRLRIGVADGAHRDEAVRSLVALMDRQRIAPLGTRPREDAKEASTIGRFYYRGTPGINYDDADTAQMLVRVASRDLPKLVDGLTQSTGTEHVSLVAGPFVFDGLEETRSTLLSASEYGSARTTDAPSKPKSSGGRFAEKNAGKPAASPSFDVLLEMLGVDPEWLDGAASQRSDVIARAERSRSIEGHARSEAEPNGKSAAAPAPTLDEAPSATTTTPYTDDERVARLDSGGLGKNTDPAAGAPHTTPTPTVAQVKGAKSRSGHPSLVERGIHSMEQSRARHRASGRLAPAAAQEAEGLRDNGPPDRFVTLVIEFFVAKQDAPRVRPTRSGARRGPRVKAKKPTSEQRTQE